MRGSRWRPFGVMVVLYALAVWCCTAELGGDSSLTYKAAAMAAGLFASFLAGYLMAGRGRAR